MKRLIQAAVTVALFGFGGQLGAQPGWKADFSALESKAIETVEVNLDAKMLNLAIRFLSNADAEEREIREIVEDLQGIYIYSFVFERDWEYDKSVAESVRKQIGKGWQKMVTVRSRNAEDVDVWIRPGESTVDGIFIIAAEPREFTVVNILGSIDMDKLSRLEGQFGIPDLELSHKPVVEKRSNR